MEKREPFPMNEMDDKFDKIVIFSKQYKILEIQKCYLMALVFIFDIHEMCPDSIICVEVEQM